MSPMPLIGVTACRQTLGKYDSHTVGDKYVEAAGHAGVPVVLQRYPGMIHGFLAFPLAARQAALDLAIAWLRDLPPAT